MLDLEKYLKDSLNLFKDNWKDFTGIYIIYTLIGLLAIKLGPFMLFIIPPFYGALFIISLKCIRTNNIDVSDLLSGFKFYIPLMLVSVIVGILSFFGFFFLLFVPGILISVIYLFVIPLIVDQNMGFWEAMEASRKKVMENLWGYCVLGLLVMALMILGSLALGIGILITMPVAINSLCFAYLDVFDRKHFLKT